MEEMRQNVEAAQHKSFEAEQCQCNALREYVDMYDRDQGLLAINAEWRQIESGPRKTLGRHGPQPGEWAGAKKRKRQSCGSSRTVTNNTLAALNLSPR